MRILLCALLLVLQCWVAHVHAESATDQAAWLEDIDDFAKELPKRHKNLFLNLSREIFVNDVARLKSDLPNLSRTSVVFRLQQILAKVGDLHTSVIRKSDLVFPIAIEQFGNDFYVTAVAQPELRDLLGAKLVSIDSVKLAELRQAANSLISAENKFARKAFAPRVITDAQALHFLGVTKKLDAANFEFEAKGRLLSLEVRAELAIPKAAWLYAFQTLPLSMSRPTEIYWYQEIPEAKAIYINYSRCEERKDLSFLQFVSEVSKLIDQQQMKRVVIDLRANPGGQEAIIRPLIQALKDRKLSVDILIGRRTFSSAFGNALSLKTELKGTLVGEPTGQKPNAFGEVRTLTLKNLDLKVQYSTQWWSRIRGDDPDALYPDIAIEMTNEQFQNGEDAVLEAALRR